MILKKSSPRPVKGRGSVGNPKDFLNYSNAASYVK
jgi:hypothetical protein